jgi:hypothetical protein
VPEAPGPEARPASDIPPLFAGTPDEAPYLAWKASAATSSEAVREYAGLLQKRGERELTDAEKARMRDLEPEVQSAKGSFLAAVEAAAGRLASSESSSGSSSGTGSASGADKSASSGLTRSGRDGLAALRHGTKFPEEARPAYAIA